MTVLEKSKFIDLTGPFPANPAQCAGRRQHARWRTGIKLPSDKGKIIGKPYGAVC
jgi:hypothetical protein